MGADSSIVGADAVAARLAEICEAKQIPYAIGGALAFGVWGLPRGTMDVDVNMFIDEADLTVACDALRALGCEVDEARVRAQVARGGMFDVHLGLMRIDVFIPSIPFSSEAANTKRRGIVGGREVWVLSAEAIAVFKLLFFRSKDIVDLERLIGVQQERLDCAYIRKHIVEMMGEDDERVKRWDALWQEHGPEAQPQ